MARTYGIGLIPWSPLAGGLLTGKYRRGQEPPADSRLGASQNDVWKRRLASDQIWDVVEGIEALAREKGCSMSQFALAWCMQQSGITSPIIGPRTMEQLEDNLKAADVKISEEDHKRIDELILPGTHVAPYYEADFGPHQYR
jgi:aryl-alcohol dehydrogenase-like predicted oxidoreductase